MGTRSIILLKQGDSYTRLYKHYDGYPSSTLPLIARAIYNSTIKTCLKSSFKSEVIDSIEKLYRAKMVEFETISPSFKLEFLGEQADLEYLYLVDLDALNIDIYGGGYIGDGPAKHYRNGKINPFIEIDAYMVEYKLQYKKLLKEVLKETYSYGIAVNGILENESKEKQVKESEKQTEFVDLETGLKFADSQSLEHFQQLKLVWPNKAKS